MSPAQTELLKEKCKDGAGAQQRARVGPAGLEVLQGVSSSVCSKSFKEEVAQLVFMRLHVDG